MICHGRLCIGSDFIGDVMWYFAHSREELHKSWIALNMPDQKSTFFAICVFEAAPKWLLWNFVKSSFCIDAGITIWCPL